MNKEMQFKVTRAENGLTLIEFISNRMKFSRNRAKAIIDGRRVFVNNRRVWMARHRLKTEDNVSCPADAENSTPLNRAIALYEDDHYLVVAKPAGIPSNGPKSLEKKLTVLFALPELLACHRLDKDTTGCLIFAKSAEAKERIVALFARNEVRKKYEAVVRGRLPEKTMTITAPIDGQKAITRVFPANATPFASHVLISIETGRTHQIRKHLASIGHPVLGDQQYGLGREIPQHERLIGRQILHAVEIKFTQPFSGIPVTVRAPLPADMKECLKKLCLK